MSKQQNAAAAERTLSLMVGAWRRGFEETQRVGFDDYKKANSFRLRLYIAVRKYRKDESIDPELSRMLGCLEAVIEEAGGRHYVVIRKVDDNPELARIAAELGIPWGFEAEAAESLKRIQDNLSQSGVKVEPVKVEPKAEGLSFEEGLSVYDDD